MIRVPHRFYRQVTYDEQLQAYVFIYINALVMAETSMYVISMNQQKEILDTIQRLGNLDKLGQRNVTEEPSICYAKM